MNVSTPARPRLLFFSRGRGRGHAVPDLAVARELEQIVPVDIHFASYATGAAVLKEAGREVVDLGLAEEPSFLELLVRSIQAIASVEPSAVVSHEEFAVLPAAKTFGLPTSFIVDFFAPVEILKDSLRYADEILFTEQRGVFPEPKEAKGRIRYLGPVVRGMTLRRSDRDRCRQALGLPASATVVAVIPGAWASEGRAPVADLVVPAFSALNAPEKRLVWVTGRDHDLLQARLGSAGQAVAIREHSPIEQLMVASDLVITKANRGTTIDLASLGVPSISLSFGLNPVDDAVVPRIRSNVALDARGIDARFLAEAIESVLATASDCAPSAEYAPGGAVRAAQRLAEWLAESLAARRGPDERPGAP